MSVQELLQADLEAAIRQGDVAQRDTVRLLLAALQNAAIENRGPLDEAGEVAVLRRQARQRQDAITLYKRGGREELAARERAELAVIDGYLAPFLPPAIDAATVEAAARGVIAEVGASGPGDIGKVMTPLMKLLGPGAEGGLVSATVRRLLSQ